MKCPPDKHEITLWMSCDLFQRVQEAAQFTGCGDDIERYIKILLSEHC